MNTKRIMHRRLGGAPEGDRPRANVECALNIRLLHNFQHEGILTSTQKQGAHNHRDQ